MATMLNSVPAPYGNTYRGFGSEWFNANAIAAEDWIRSEQSADLAQQRALELIRVQNEFNSVEAEKQFEREKELSSTAYQRAVEDLKKSGLNPILAYSNGGASTPAINSAVSGSGSSYVANAGYKGKTANTGVLVGSILKLVGQIVAIQAGKIVPEEKHFGF